jgi:hypothetical protein
MDSVPVGRTKRKTRVSYNSFSVGPSVLGLCVALAEDSTAGILLYRIHGRSRKSRLKHDGVKGWVALTREQWMDDTTLSRNQYERALTQLKRKNLVVITRPWRNKKGMGTPPSFIRLEDEVTDFITNFDEHMTVPHIRGTDSPTNPDSRGTEGGTNPHIRGVIYTLKNKNTEEKTLKASPPVNAGAKAKKSAGQESQTEKIGEVIDMEQKRKGLRVIEGKRQSFEDVLKKAQEPEDVPFSLKTFEQFWRRHVGKVCGVQPVLSRKEHKILGDLCRKLDNEGKDVGAALLLVIYNWEKFCAFAGEQKKLYKGGGTYPNILTLSALPTEILLFYHNHGDAHTNAETRKDRRGTSIDDLLNDR